METLIYFVLWAAAIFLMMRLGCGAHVMGHDHRTPKTGDGSEPGRSPSLRWVPPDKDTDPVCKKIVVTNNAKSSVYAGHVYYFCSRECREAFEAAPNLYIKDLSQSRRELEPSNA